MQNEKEIKGHCIRCSTQIVQNSQIPFCNKCYKVWNTHKNKNYIENYCHHCAEKKSNLSINNPICDDCIKRL